MLNNAFVTVQIKDLWSAKANTIAKATDKMNASIKRFEKQFGGTANKINSFTQKIGQASGSVTKFSKRYNELETLKVTNLNNLVKGDLKKEINEVDKLTQKIKALSGAERGSTSTAKMPKERTVGGDSQKGGNNGNMLRTVLTTATGVGFLRSAITNATQFDSALYDINRQLSEDENLQDYVKFIEQYSLATGANNVEVAQQTAELRKTLKAGEGLDTIKDRMQLMTFAVNQLEVDSVTAAKSVEVIGKAFKLSTNELKGFFSQANQMEDFYGAMVTGGDLLEIIARMPITLMENTKLMSKETTLMLATFAKANTALDASAVGYNLGKVLEGGTKARGGGIIASAEREGKTVEQYLFKLRNEFAKLKTVAEQNDFIEMISGTNDLQAKDVFRSLLKELSKVDDAKVNSFANVQKQFEAGKISSIEYRKEMEKLNEAEKTFVARNIKTAESIKEFDRVMKLLGDRHEATLGRMGDAWRLVTGAFGSSILFPALNLLADGLEKVTPFITQFIKDYPLFIGVLTGTVAIAGIMGIIKAFGGLNLALGSVLLTMRAIATNPVFLALSAGALIFDQITKTAKGLKGQELFLSSSQSLYLTEQLRGLKGQERLDKEAEIRRQYRQGTTVQDLQNKNTINTMQNFQNGSMSIPTPLTQPQLQPRGAIDVNVMVNGQAQVETNVKKQDNVLLSLFQTTTTRTI